MVSGRRNKLTGQTGEYLVAAELSRRGMITTTFTGNVPHFDLIACDEDGSQVAIQVKAARSGSWQFSNINLFCEIEIANKQQFIKKAKTAPVKRLIFILVKITDEASLDRFYVLTWSELQELVIEKYADLLKRNNGVRPRKWDSFHIAIKERMLTPFRDRWQSVQAHLA